MKDVEAARITREIEDAVTTIDYPGEGILTEGFGLGRMFIELPYAVQWKELNERVNWHGLTATEKEQVMTRVLEDVREKIPDEIYPATWFDGIRLSVDPAAKVYTMKEAKNQLQSPDRSRNLDERVCTPERIKEKKTRRW